MITVVADRVPTRIAGLLYLDASLPSNGQSMLDFMGDSQGIPALFRAQAAERGEGWRVPAGLPFDAAGFGIDDAADAAWVNRRISDHPLAAFTEPVLLSGAGERVTRRSYCAWHKAGGFIGRDALRAQRDGGPLKRRLVQFLLDDPAPVLVHNEPILRDGERVGLTTSAGYGHTLGASVAMGYLHCEDGVTPAYVAAGTYRIDQANRVYSARASLTPMYDGKNLRYTS